MLLADERVSHILILCLFKCNEICHKIIGKCSLDKRKKKTANKTAAILEGNIVFMTELKYIVHCQKVSFFVCSCSKSQLSISDDVTLDYQIFVY